MTEKYSGLAITPKELQKFMIEEQARFSLFLFLFFGKILRKTQTGTNFSNFQGYSLSVDECSEIIRDYEMKDTQVLSKVTNLYMGQTAFLR